LWLQPIKETPIVRTRALFLILIGLLSLTGCVSLGGTSQAIRAKDRVASALVHVRPIIQVYSQGRSEEILTIGSGFIISPDGYVVTNEHVAGKSKLVRCVLFDKEEIEAEVVGTDPYTDIAVLKLKTDRRDLPYARLGTSKDLQAGQTVLALGSPHGLARSVSQGIVSVTDRYLSDMGEMVSPYNTWIQTDAAINQGNSGGPLVDLHGRVVGVNARRLRMADNVGFAIPIDTASEVINAIIEHGRVRRSWVGLTLQEMTAMTDDPRQKGAVIADIDPLSPAYEAGIRPGAVLLAVNGKSVNARFEEDLPAVRKQIADLPIGEEAVFTILEGEKKEDVRVVTEEKSDLQGQEVEFPAWGFTATELTPQIVRRARLDSRHGILVTGAQVGSVAANAGLRANDIVLTMDKVAIRDLAHFQELYDERTASGQPMILLDVKRGALTRFLLLKQDLTGTTDTPPEGAVDLEEDYTDDANPNAD